MDGNSHIVADHDGLADSAGEDEHYSSLPLPAGTLWPYHCAAYAWDGGRSTRGEAQVVSESELLNFDCASVSFYSPEPHPHADG